MFNRSDNLRKLIYVDEIVNSPQQKDKRKKGESCRIMKSRLKKSCEMRFAVRHGRKERQNTELYNNVHNNS